ncbi:MAG TPA: hypothetical protein VFM88_17415 [Vicinamibacteria bacterium]|nr:hypothetical protein [Vicinamibacteria bacterium]
MTPGGRWPCLLLVAATALLPSLQVLEGDFVADDFGCLRLWGQKPLAEFAAFGDISEGIWGVPIDEPRPVDALTFRLGFLVSGASPWGHLLLALAIHVGCSLLVFALARLAVADAPVVAALAASLLFAVHPVHAEPIAWVTGKVDSLASLFYLAAFALFLRRRGPGGGLRYAAALALFVAGLLAKEVLLTLPPLLVAAEAILGPAGTASERWRRAARAARAAAPLFLIAVLYLVARRLAFGSFAREHRIGSETWNLLAERQAFNLGRLLMPATGVLAALLAAAMLVGLVCLVRDRIAARGAVAPIAFFAIVFYGATSAPLVLTYASARHLYLPSAGIAVAAGIALFPSASALAWRAAALAAAVAVLVPGLRREERHWIDAGRTSRALRASIEEATRELPPQATVVLAGVPASDGDALVWRAALPFALEPPFLPRSVPGSVRLLEPPALYCCPFEQWWQARAPIVRQLLDGPDDEAVPLQLLEWRREGGRLARRSAAPARGAIRLTLEQAGVDAVSGPAGLREGSRLVAALAQAARGGAGRPRRSVSEAAP